MANHALPATTDTYANVLSYLHARIDDASKWYDSALILSNPPTGVVRWNSTGLTWEKNSGTPAAPSWGALSTSYNININGTVGATTAAAGTFTTLSVTSSAALPSGATVNSSAIVHVGNTAQSLAGAITFSNATSPIISAKIGPSSTQQHTIPAVTSDTITLIGATQTLTNKTISGGTLSGTTAGDTTLSGIITHSHATSPIISAKIGPSSTQQHAIPAVTSDTIALLGASQTLTNKSLTSPAITGGSVDNAAIGSTTASTGAFTTLTTSGAVTLSPSSANVVLSPTGTGVVTINPATAGSINRMNIGATTAGTGAFTTLTASDAVTLSPSDKTVTISPAGTTGTVVISPIAVGSINKMNIGATTAGTGAFTTLSASSTVSGAGFSDYFASPPAIGGTVAAAGTFTTLTATGAVSLSPSSANVVLSPTGTGVVTINPATAGSINKMNIGATTAGTGAFTTLTASDAVTLSPSDKTVTISPGGTTGTVVISPIAVGSINKMNIGATTAGTGAFTTLTTSGAVTLSPSNASITISPTGTGTVTINPATAGSINNIGIGGTTAAGGAFTTLSASSTVSGSGFSTYLASPPAIGGTAAAAGSFTTLTASTSIISSAGYMVLGGTTQTSAAVLLDLQSTTKGLKFPVMTTVQKTAITGVSGLVVYDSNLNKLSCFNGTAWGSVGGGATGGGTDDIFYENGQTVVTSYSITTGKNAMSAGPITLNTGITVTVPDGSTWTVV